MFIGQSLGLSFAGYLIDGVPPAAVGLTITWLVIRWQWAGRWTDDRQPRRERVQAPRFDRWQTAKGLAVLAATVACFLATPWPREIIALGAAGILLLSRRMASREMIGLVDWHLLLLFAGLFVVNDAVARAGLLAEMYAALGSAGIDLRNDAWLFALTPIASNLVSNVPAVMLLLPASEGPQAGPVLALASTFAGNLLIVGSIANIIVVEEGIKQGIAIGWRTHIRTGAPVTVATLAAAALWLWMRA
jgi:Na+/H+ antiporter NhaD/arsenite permease-like protein